MSVKLPVYRKFRLANIPDAQPWVNDMYSNLNLFGEQIESAFKNGTDINMVQGAKFSTTFTTSATYNTGDFQNILFKYSGAGTPDCFLIGNISRQDGQVILIPPVITNVFLNNNLNPPVVTVGYIAGLSNSTTYNITILAL